MRLTIERDAALTAVAKVRGSSSTAKDTIPILGFVLLEAAAGGLVMTTTNLDMQARVSVSCTVEAGGSVAVPVTLLHDMLKSLPSGGELDVSMAAGERLRLVCGRSRLELPTLPASDFPSFPFEGAAAVGEIGGASLARMIDRTRFAISTEATRYYLGGLYLHITQAAGVPCLRVVATNGHQLAWADAEVPEGVGDMPAVILPRGLVAELRRLIVPGASAVFAIQANLVRFTVDGVELTSKVIDGTYPDYPRAVPAGEGARVRVSRAALLAAMKRAQLVAKDKERSFTLRIRPDAMQVEARSFELGAMVDDVAAEYGGEPFHRNFNASYLAEMVELISGDAVDLTFHGNGDRLTITEEADPAALLLLVGHKLGGPG